MIKAKIEGKDYNFPKGITLEEMLEETKLHDNRIVVAAIMNNRLVDLSDAVEEDAQIRYVTMNEEMGNRIYRRSLYLVMTRAIQDLYPGSRLLIEHSLSNGIYCELHKDRPLCSRDLALIKEKMMEYIKRDLPIRKLVKSKSELVEIFEKQGYLDKVEIMSYLERDIFTVYELEGNYDYYFYNLAPRTGILDRFDLHLQMPGFILLHPKKGKPYEVPEYVEQEKLAGAFHEFEKWGKIIGVSTVNDLNNIIKKGKFKDLVNIMEALHEKKIAKIADQIAEDQDKNKIILIAGPSSSGKTTFAQRLSIQLRVNGINPVSISTDDYFVDREKTPRDENGDYDFEAIEAIDLELLNEDLLALLQGERVEIPTFNFLTGKREYRGNYLQVDREHPIIIEGIHSLNDRLTEFIPENNKFKIYISALTQINIDRHNRIPTTDNRLLRRMVRDNFFRNSSAAATLEWWPAVRKGEEKNIFPFQENADVMFNSGLVYELAILKKYATPLLKEITPEEEVYYQAERLLEILDCFLPMDEDAVPGNSILKEFIGGSIFE
ncbi:MAG: nucleoside kinase [Halanaerobiaceae bacterium]|nr:nucleoside kinase [Halanaerobiaceae bacterium]